MSTARVRRYECLGGPLCGKRIEDGLGTGGLFCADEEGIPHFYRLIRVARNDYSAAAVFFHYFGSSPTRARDAAPTLVPHDRLFKQRKRK